jgi:hypothetical protein
VQPFIPGVVAGLVLGGVGLIGWLLPDRDIWGFTGRRRSTCATLCLVSLLFVLIALLGIPVGQT